MATTNGNHPSSVSPLLIERLNEPRTVEALNRLLDHAELLAFSAASLDGFIRRSEVIADNLAAGVQELRQTLPAVAAPSGEQLGRLMQQLPQLIETTNRLAEMTTKPEFQALLTMLGNPTTLNALNNLLSHADLISYLISALDSFLQRGELIADNLRDGFRELGKAMPEGSAGLINTMQTLSTAMPYVPQIVEVLPKLIEILTQIEPYIPRLVAVAPQFVDIIEELEPFVASPEFDALLDSGVFHADTVSLVGRAGDAFVESVKDNKRTKSKVGIFSLLRSFSDPDMQRAVGLVLDFAKRFGRSLDRS